MVEVPADDEAPAPAQPGQRVRRDGSGLDIGVVDDRPDRLAAVAGGQDLVHLGADPLFGHAEHVLDRAARGGDAGPERGLDLPDGTGQVGRRRFPVRKRGKWRGGQGGGMRGHGSSF